MRIPKPAPRERASLFSFAGIELYAYRARSWKGYIDHASGRYHLTNYQQISRTLQALNAMKQYRPKDLEVADAKFFHSLTLFYAEQRLRDPFFLPREAQRLSFKSKGKPCD